MAHHTLQLLSALCLLIRIHIVSLLHIILLKREEKNRWLVHVIGYNVDIIWVRTTWGLWWDQRPRIILADQDANCSQGFERIYLNNRIGPVQNTPGSELRDKARTMPRGTYQLPL